MPPLAAAGAAAARGTGAALKQAVRSGKVLTGLFVNSASPLVAEQLATLPYDYMLVSASILPTLLPAHACPPLAGLCAVACEPPGIPLPCPALLCAPAPAQVDIQHAPTDYQLLGACITAVNAAGKPALVRVEGPHDRGGIQQVQRGLGCLGNCCYQLPRPDAVTLVVATCVASVCCQAQCCRCCCAVQRLGEARGWQ